MAKLFFKYSAMNAGKTTMAIQVAHNYEETGNYCLVCKPSIDTKGEDNIVSRIGIERKVDYKLTPDTSPIKIVDKELLKVPEIGAIIVDEAQFLTEKQVNELYYITKMRDIPVLCFGLRCDFQMKLFPGSERLLAIADEIEETKCICAINGCTRKATQNVRFINDEIIFEGDQVAIDGTSKVTYKSFCGKHYIEAYMKYQNEKPMTLERKK